MSQVHREDAAENARLLTEAQNDPWDDDFNRLMDATQTLIQLEVGDVLTQAMIDDLHLVDKDHRESFDRATDAFSKGYEAGLARGAGADTARLIEERDEARTKAAIANSISSHAERWGFIKGAQVCREMMARFVEQGGNPIIAQSIRLNWRPDTWGDDPGAPDEQTYQSAPGRGIAASGIKTEGHDGETRHGAKHESPAPKGDAHD